MNYIEFDDLPSYVATIEPYCEKCGKSKEKIVFDVLRNIRLCRECYNKEKI